MICIYLNLDKIYLLICRLVSLIELKRDPEKNFILVNRDFPKMINLEKIISNFNIKRYFTSPSSSIFLTKVLKSKISIYDYGSYWRKFLKNNWSLFKHKNNFNNYLVASKLYRNISNKL